MPFIPNWIHGTDVLGAASSGANLGLGIRRQRESEESNADQLQLQRQSAADQLQLARDQMFERSLRAQEDRQERQGEAAARLAQASAQLALQAGHYQDAKEMQAAAQALTESHYKALEEAATKREDDLNTFRKQKAQLPEGEDPSQPTVASDVLAGDGTLIARVLNNKNGTRHMIPLSAGVMKSPIEANPAALRSYLSEAQSILRDKESTFEEKANARARIAQAAPNYDKSLGYPTPDMVQQVTTNAPAGWLQDPTYTTNAVPRSAASMLQAPQGLPTTQVRGPAQSKAQVANQLAQQHPDWDRKRIKDEVEALFSGVK